MTHANNELRSLLGWVLAAWQPTAALASKAVGKVFSRAEPVKEDGGKDSRQEDAVPAQDQGSSCK